MDKTPVKDFFYMYNGERRVSLDGKFFNDSLSVNVMLKGQRLTQAFVYLRVSGFSEEEAQEYLDKLPEIDMSNKKIY